jgi:2-polyprenyl-6-methoxyphenol hydroxylase-like FAD-dependent oxidoreductase
VGADGVHSVTRRLIDPDAPDGRYVGLVNFGGYTPEPAHTPDAAAAHAGQWHMFFGRRAFFGYAADSDGGTVWFANVPRPPVSRAERASTTTGAWQRQLVELFADDRGPASSLIAAGTLELSADNTHDLPSVPTWRNDAMVIIGDAAHSPSPSCGQGASMAAEDGVVLAMCLREQPDVRTALAGYGRVRRARVERIVKQGARTSSSKASGPVARVLRDLMLPFVFRHLVTERSQVWLFDHHIDWDAPAAAGTA